MTYVKFEPYRGFEKLGRRMNEFFNEFEKGVSFEMGGFNPRVDITEDDTKLYVHAELAGIDKEKVKISVNEDRVLTIQGEKAKPELPDGKRFIRNERMWGGFNRSLVLADNIDIEHIEAKFDNGVLELIMPKIEPPKPKEIEVKIG